MPTLLRLLQLLAIVTWVGGLLFFAFVLAPTAFATYPTVHEAGLIVGASLRVFDVVALVCGAVFLLATGILFGKAPMRIRGRYEIEFLLAAIMLLATAYIHFNILPSMDRDRDRANGDITSVPIDHPARIHFDELHKRSERVEAAVLLCGLAVIVLMSREQLPIPAESQP
jgi:uncharacterized membrane protein